MKDKQTKLYTVGIILCYWHSNTHHTNIIRLFVIDENKDTMFLVATFPSERENISTKTNK